MPGSRRCADAGIDVPPAVLIPGERLHWHYFHPCMAIPLQARPSFSTSFAYRLDTPAPPTKPPKTLTFGSSCFRATVDMMLDTDDKASDATSQVPGWHRIGTVTGYDKSPRIAQETEQACRQQARAVGDPKLRCGEASLTMLRSSDKQCEGEMYFEMNNTVRKIL